MKSIRSPVATSFFCAITAKWCIYAILGSSVSSLLPWNININIHEAIIVNDDDCTRKSHAGK